MNLNFTTTYFHLNTANTSSVSTQLEKKKKGIGEIAPDVYQTIKHDKKGSTTTTTPAPAEKYQFHSDGTCFSLSSMVVINIMT